MVIAKENVLGAAEVTEFIINSGFEDAGLSRPGSGSNREVRT